MMDISIHALLAESDLSTRIIGFSGKVFLSTLSLRRATETAKTSIGDIQFLSTLSLRRATHYDNYNLHCVEISIHALLAESDQPVASDLRKVSTAFLSTLSLRRATTAHTAKKTSIAISIHALLAESDSRAETVTAKISHFYPRSPCGERQAGQGA